MPLRVHSCKLLVVPFLVASLDNSLEVFFDLVPTGAALCAPVYDHSGELVDFRFARLNPAGQRLLGLPAQPPHSFREYYPHSVPTGIFAQYVTAYLTGQAVTYDVPYVGDGLDTYFRLVAQRSGDTNGAGGKLDQPSEVLLKGKQLIVTDYDDPVKHFVNTKADAPHTESVLDLP